MQTQYGHHSSKLLQAVAIRSGPDTTHTTHTADIVLSVDIHATARYSLSAIEYSTGCSNKIISASLCISTASVSAYLTDLSPSPSVGLCVCVRLCVCRKVYCGKMAEWIRMPFGMVSGVSRMMGVLNRVEGAVLGVNLGRPTVTNGDYPE